MPPNAGGLRQQICFALSECTGGPNGLGIRALIQRIQHRPQFKRVALGPIAITTDYQQNEGQLIAIDPVCSQV